MTEQERHDQQKFDEAVARKGKLVLQVLAGVGIVAALLMSVAALSESGSKTEATVAASPAASQAATAQPPAAASGSSAPAAAKVVSLKIIPEYKVGPEGKKHDAFTVTNFHVTAGQPETLKIDNTDEAPHSISSPEAGVNIIVQPGTHTYKLLVSKAGKYEWFCSLPCDDWAMQRPGYMSGYITAAA